jgi:hypothetical protein
LSAAPLVATGAVGLEIDARAYVLCNREATTLDLVVLVFLRGVV